MIEGVDSKKQLLTAMPLIKGFNFFKSSHVLYIGNLHEIEKQHTYIKSQSVGLNVHKFSWKEVQLGFILKTLIWMFASLI